MTKYSQTCHNILEGKRCTRPGCLYDHTPSQSLPQQQWSPPAQSVVDQRAQQALQPRADQATLAALQKAHAEMNRYKQMVLNAQNLAAQNMHAANFQAAPAPTVHEGAKATTLLGNGAAQVDPWHANAQKTTIATENARTGRDATPGPGARDRGASLASVSPGGGDKHQPGGPCYAASRGVCQGPLKTPPCTRCIGPEPPKPLIGFEALKRDRWEVSMDKQGKAVPYIRTTAQINAALANVEANKNDQKGKG